MKESPHVNNTTDGLVVCDKAHKCTFSACYHATPHKPVGWRNLQCVGISCPTGGGICIPVPQEPIDEADLNPWEVQPPAQPAPSLHERMWDRLRADLQDMQDEGAKALDPVIALRFMGYIEEVEKED